MGIHEEVLIRELNEGEEFPLELIFTADPSRELVEEYTARGKCFIATYREDVIGEYILLMTRPKVIEIINIAVSENMQGKGIGKLLIMDAIQRAKSYGAGKLEIGTGNSSLGQLALYQKCGFRIIDVDRDYFNRYYDKKIYENGIECIDMIRLSMEV